MRTSERQECATQAIAWLSVVVVHAGQLWLLVRPPSLGQVDEDEQSRLRPALLEPFDNRLRLQRPAGRDLGPGVKTAEGGTASRPLIVSALSRDPGPNIPAGGVAESWRSRTRGKQRRIDGLSTGKKNACPDHVHGSELEFRSLPRAFGEGGPVIGKLSWTALAASLASAGLGLLLWLGISIALLQGSGTEMVALRSMQHAGLLLACVLALAAVYSLHFASSSAGGTRWRHLAIGALVLALASTAALMVLLTRKPPDVGWISIAAALLSLAAIITVLAQGMLIATSGRADWRQQLVAPSCLAYALLAGAALLFALIAIKWPGQDMLSAPAPSLVMLLVVMGALKLLYWFENGGMRARTAEHSAQDPLRMRLSVLSLLVLVPLLLCAGLILWPGLAPKTAWCVIALVVLAGGYRDCQLLAMEAGFPTASGEAPETLPTR